MANLPVAVNRKYQRSGHLLQRRFKGIIVEKDRYLIALSRYIHLNPVRAKSSGVRSTLLTMDCAGVNG
jgi:hypothetical protein